MQFKKGSGWKACCDENNGRCFIEYGDMQDYHIYEITKQMFDRLQKDMKESEASEVAREGRHMYMSVNDRCGPPYTVVFDDEYKQLCPWADVVGGSNVWPDELTDAAVKLFEPEKNNRGQRRRKRRERERKKTESEREPQCAPADQTDASEPEKE